MFGAVVPAPCHTDLCRIYRSTYKLKIGGGYLASTLPMLLLPHIEVKREEKTPSIFRWIVYMIYSFYVQEFVFYYKIMSVYEPFRNFTL